MSAEAQPGGGPSQTQPHGQSRPKPSRAAQGVKFTAIGVTVLALLAAVQGLPVTESLERAINWVDQLGAAGPAVFVAIYFVATMLMLPAWPLSVAAGMLFGLLGGTLTVVAGATAGAAGAFVLTRYLARGFVEEKIRHYPRFAAVDRAMGQGGWKIVALLRLSPALPFTLQNYVYGLTAIRFWPCILATAGAILPGVFMYVYIGYAGRAGLSAAAEGAPAGPAQYALLGAGLIATVVVTVYVTRLARKAIRQYGELAPEAENAEAGTVAAASAGGAHPWRGAIVAVVAAVLAVFLAGLIHIQPAFIADVLAPPAAAGVQVHPLHGR